MYCVSLQSYFFGTVGGSFLFLIPSHSRARVDGKGRRLIEETRFKDQEAFDYHSKTESFGTFVTSLKEEDVLAKPFELLFGNPAGGFVRT